MPTLRQALAQTNAEEHNEAQARALEARMNAKYCAHTNHSEAITHTCTDTCTASLYRSARRELRQICLVQAPATTNAILNLYLTQHV